MNIEQLREMCPPSLQKMNPHIFGGDAVELPEAIRQEKNEATLQALCERWLISRGYGRRVPKKLQTHTTGKWFLHFPQARGNPIVLDLLLLNSNTGDYLELELKVDGGTVSPDQRALTIRKEGVLCWGFDQFRQAVELWELAVAMRSSRHA